MKVCLDCKKQFDPQLSFSNGLTVSKRCWKCLKERDRIKRIVRLEIKKRKKFEKSLKKKEKKPKTEQQLVEKLRKKAVKLAKDISKKRDNYKCCYCGVGKPQRQVHSHHFFHEGMFKSMSADIDNLITLCATHHQGGVWMKSASGFNFHNSPRESTEWFFEHYPKRYEELKIRSLCYQKLDRIFWENKLAELKTYAKNHLLETQTNLPELGKGV